MTPFVYPDVLFSKSDRTGLFIRPRVNALLTQAIKKPLAVVCAGMGYGKTLAVSDFVREIGIPAMWMQFSEFDNVGLSFWENYVRAIEQINKPLAEEIDDLGFPDTEDKLNQYYSLHDRAMADQRYLTVLDDVHLVKDPSVVNFIERVIYSSLPNRSIILISRDISNINISGLLVRGIVSNLNENDLSFTENELAQYLLQQELASEIRNLPDILQDTEGWAFIINFLVRILKKTPGYTGYVRKFMKQNIFQLMEREAWNAISGRLQRFMVRLSLVNRLSPDMVSILTDGDESLHEEFNRQRVVYIRFDSYTGRYLIHRLFQDFLQSKQDILSPEETYSTYKAVAEWSVKNGFNIDALNYYEKMGDYKSLVPIILESPTQLLLSAAQHLKGIFDRAPDDTFNKIENFACAHVRILILAGLWRDALELLKDYESKLLSMTDDEFRSNTLGGVYFFWGVLRQLMCTVDDKYDFDAYYRKLCKYSLQWPIGQICDNLPVGPWFNRAGASRQGAPNEYLDSIARSAEYVSKSQNNWMDGLYDLGQGELFFYQGEINSAKFLIARAYERAERGRQYVIAHLALFYAMRVAVYQGDYAKADLALKDMEAHLEINEYYNRFSDYDIALGWYYYILRQPNKIPGWLKGKFTSYFTANLLDNFGNIIKSRYFYLTKNYTALLAFIEEHKKQEHTLYGRIEMLALEACARYQTKDITGSFAALQEAYEAASPNDIVVPFIEMGKDIRTLTLAALRDPDCKIPQPWLTRINQKSFLYARRQTLIISEYKKANDIDTGIGLSPRETEILNDLNKGFSRSEIAANQGLSINTVRLIINTIYEKLKARNIADLIRIAHEQKLI